MSIKDEFGSQAVEAACKAYIGVKGDANLDGEPDSKDAAEILVYAAAVGAGNEASIYSEIDEITEAFALWLTEVNNSGAVDAKDAALILAYAAANGSGNKTTWEGMIDVPAFININNA